MTAKELALMGVNNGYFYDSEGNKINLVDLMTGKGITVYQHDSNMLDLGRSKVAVIKQSLTADQYFYIELTVPDGVIHHAEGRYVQSYDGICEMWVIPNYDGSVPEDPTRETLWNEQGPTLIAEENQLSYFRSWEPQGTLPIDTDPENTRTAWIDYVTLYGTSGSFFTASEKDEFASVVGRQYYPNRHGVLFKATEDCDITYIYRFHDFT